MTWPPAPERLPSWRGGFRLPVRNSPMPKASWLVQGNSLQLHPAPKAHLEQMLQMMQLPFRLEHLNDLLAYAQLPLFEDEVTHAVTS